MSNTIHTATQVQWKDIATFDGYAYILFIGIQHVTTLQFAGYRKRIYQNKLTNEYVTPDETPSNDWFIGD